MILSAGESLIDMVPEGASYRPLPGGAVYNTAIALGRMGAASGYLWPISRDAFGQMLLRLSGEGTKVSIEVAGDPQPKQWTIVGPPPLSRPCCPPPIPKFWRSVHASR